MAQSLQSANNLFSGFGYIWQKVGVDWRESTHQSVIFGSLGFLDITSLELWGDFQGILHGVRRYIM